METLALNVLFLSIGLLAYTYIGFPIVLWILSMFFRRMRDGTSIPFNRWPRISVILSAHNEEAVIGRRIENLLALDYPPDRLQILIGSDGSTDRTSEIARLYRDARIVFHDFARQRGKASVLNDLVERARGEYLVFTDANTLYDPQAVKELLQGFREVPSACAVVGRLVLRTAEGTVNPDSLYWRYETILKRLESRLGTVLGANGPIYAVKRKWYRPLPPGTIVDDFLIPMLIRLERGGSVIFRPSAWASETAPETVQHEFRRRVRIGAGDAHALLYTWRLLLPGQGLLALCFWSHKVLRWMGPWLLIIVFVSTLWLLKHPWAQVLLSAQVSIYLLGLLSPLFRRFPLFGRMATATWYFMALNAALLLGTMKFLTGRAAPTWQRTPRTADISQCVRPHWSRSKTAERSHSDSPAA